MRRIFLVFISLLMSNLAFAGGISSGGHNDPTPSVSMNCESENIKDMDGLARFQVLLMEAPNFNWKGPLLFVDSLGVNSAYQAFDLKNIESETVFQNGHFELVYSTENFKMKVNLTDYKLVQYVEDGPTYRVFPAHVTSSLSAEIILNSEPFSCRVKVSN